MITSGTGIFFDGNSSVRQDVLIELTPAALIVRNPDGKQLAQWTYPELNQIHSPDKVLRLSHGSESLARLEVRDPALAAEIDERAASVDRTGTVQRRLSMRIAALVVVAVASIATMTLIALPALATRLTPLLPFGIESRLGQAVDTQLRGSLTSSTAGLPLDCGEVEGEQRGREALAVLIGQLEAAAELPVPLRAGVLRRKEANAVALPGGQIYVFEGLIDKAESPDELAGVIAHEIGHVARRDGVRAVLETASLSFLFGMLLGDFVGGGAIVLAAKTVLQSSYSRDAEGAADAYAVALINRVGGSGEALGTLLIRIDDLHGSSPEVLSDHPPTAERVIAIRSLARPGSGRDLLDDAQWAALKGICAGR